MVNGVIFQREENRAYKGVEGDNWYLNDVYPDEFEKYFCGNIEKAWYDSDFVDVCSDNSFIDKYIEFSVKAKISFRMLLVETSKMKPQMQNIKWKAEFIGYDYAYAGGSYYSAVYNDVCSKRIDQFSVFELNRNGLFDDIDKLREFIALRERMIEQNKNLYLEQGDFEIYKLYEVIN